MQQKSLNMHLKWKKVTQYAKMFCYFTCNLIEWINYLAYVAINLNEKKNI